MTTDRDPKPEIERLLEEIATPRTLVPGEVPGGGGRIIPSPFNLPLGAVALGRDAESPGTGYAPDPYRAQLARAGISIPGVEVIEHFRVPLGGPRHVVAFDLGECNCGGRGYVDEEDEPRERYCTCAAGDRLRELDGNPSA